MIFFDVPVIFSLIAVISAVKTSNLATDLENWMSKLPESLKNVPLNNLAIPGSHDSFTNDITSKSDVSPDGEDILKKLQFLGIVKFVMANWSKTQAYNVLEQLKAGIRFFDLRICKSNKEGKNLRFCHGMYSTEVKKVFQDILTFLNSHPEEVLILDCQHFYNFTDSTHLELIKYFHSNFEDKLIPFQSNMDSLTLNNLATEKKQILLIYRDSSQKGRNLLWPDGSFPTPWYNTMNQKSLISSLNQGLKSRKSKTGYISQLILTPEADDILLNLLTSLKYKCAVEFESARDLWISNQVPGKNGVNVIIGDFVDLTGGAFSKAVINLNLKMLEIEPISWLGFWRLAVTKIANCFKFW